MFKHITSLSAKKQFYCFMAFIFGYFSPLLGVVLYFILKYKKVDKVYLYLPLIGGAIALAYYALSYIIAILF